MRIRIQAVARHEAGHVVAGFRLGLQVDGATITPGDGFDGLAFVSIPPTPAGLSDAERRLWLQGALRSKAVMISAGPAAHRSRFPRAAVKAGKAIDEANLTSIARLVTATVKGARAYIRSVEIEARELVEADAPAIDAVASALIERHVLGGAEIAAIVAAIDDERAAASYAAFATMKATGTLPTLNDSVMLEDRRIREDRARRIGKSDAAAAALAFVLAQGLDPDAIAAFAPAYADGRDRDPDAVAAKLRVLREKADPISNARKESSHARHLH